MTDHTQTRSTMSNLPLFAAGLTVDDTSTTPPWQPTPDLTTYYDHDLPPARPHNPADTTATRTPSPRPHATIDRALVRQLQKLAAEQLREYRTLRERERADPNNTATQIPFGEEEEREFGREVITNLVRSHVATTITRDGGKIDLAEEQALIKAIFDAQFNLGPLQDLVEEPDITDIFVTGDETYVKYPDGRFEDREPIVDSDTEMIEWLTNLASRSDNGGRPFSRLHPSLRLNLRGDHRLSAMHYTTRRPSVAIRIHRLKNITLNQLATEHRTMTTTLADFLQAVMRGNGSVVVSGGMGAGKTTHVRALANALPIQTRIGTAETERELFLHQLPGRRRYVVDAEVIIGGGERGVDGELAGSYTLSDILYDFVRQNLDYVIVGEVAGHEVIAMLNAMQMAKGGLSTVHAYSARSAIDRLAELGSQPPFNAPVEYTQSQLAAHIDLIVQLTSEVSVDANSSRLERRYVEEVIYVEPGEENRPATTTVYRGNPDGTGEFGTIPPPLRDKIIAGGIDPATIPLATLTRRNGHRPHPGDDRGAR